MNFQYYETLLDKSKKNLQYYLDQIKPAFTKKEMQTLLKDINNEALGKNEKSTLAKGYIKIDTDTKGLADFSRFSENQLKSLYQILISKEINTKKAVKWRLYQYLKYVRGFKSNSVYVNRTNEENNNIDFIVETETKDLIFITCHPILELDNYMELISNFIEFAKRNKIIPNKVIIAACKSYRNIPISDAFAIGNKSIIPDLWLEWVDLSKQFDGEDLLIIKIDDEDQERFELAGFNFGSTENMLDYIYDKTNGGQISIFKQIGYFSEFIQEEPQVELIWKGIMIKTN